MSRGSKVLSGTDKRKAAKAAARRGNAAYDAQDLETAIACYRESTAADPNLSADVWMTLGYAIHLQRGELGIHLSGAAGRRRVGHLRWRAASKRCGGGVLR